ncbi:MAG: hypothetical protein JRJ37_11260 [Deltaproteobacteria bacterium]|nr:hypothetical protein [Deltaproteobacteria bacterium]
MTSIYPVLEAKEADPAMVNNQKEVKAMVQEKKQAEPMVPRMGPATRKELQAIKAVKAEVKELGMDPAMVQDQGVLKVLRTPMMELLTGKKVPGLMEQAMEQVTEPRVKAARELVMGLEKEHLEKVAREKEAEVKISLEK